MKGKTTAREHGWKAPEADASLSVLLAVQILVTFVSVPLSAVYSTGPALLSAGHLVFAAVCAVTLTKRRSVQAALFGGLFVLAAGPFFSARIGFGAEIMSGVIPVAAFAFNALVSALVARRVFSSGRVTAPRIQGAVLVYLNMVALFAIAYGMIESHSIGAIKPTSGGFLARDLGVQIAELSYFSLATLTTTGYGDLVPVHPLARSLANLEAVFGQLFPATFLARLVSLHLVQSAETQTAPSQNNEAAV